MDFDQMGFEPQADESGFEFAQNEDNQHTFETYENVDDDQLGFEGYEEQQDFNYEQQALDNGDASFGFAFDDSQSTPQTLQQPDVLLPTPTPTQQQQQDASSSTESEKDKWNKKKAIELKALAEQHREEKDKAIAAGKRELELFYKNRKAAIEQAKANNRAEEKKNKIDLENTLSNGTEWQKVAKYCDLKERHDPKFAQQAAKTERMRSLLVDLRNEKPKA